MSGNTPSETSHAKPRRFSWWRLLKRVFLYSLGLLLFYTILLKWLPVPYTLTMLSRSWESGRFVSYTWVPYYKMSNHLKIAAVASEDQRFPQHWGIDYEALSKAMEENKTRSRPRGASTISQQVAKNVFLWQGGGYFRKAMELPLTYLIEAVWGKERILEVYLNVAEMGPQVFGAEAAAQAFFKKEARNLTLSEASLMIAALPNPRQYVVNQASGYMWKRSAQIQYQIQLLGGMNYIQDLRAF